MTGRTIGKYRIVGQLGRGTTGIVYKAVDETLGREVAIKLLNPDLADTELMKRFRGEATTLAKLNHPEIATIYELVRSETDLLIAMEFVCGETLGQLSARLGPMPPDRAACLIDRILAALEYAHRAGVVHRDMKPANVMVTALGVKIMDFGIARVRGAEHMTIEGSLMGTPAYIAPEQVLGHEVDGRADLYSVGVIFYRLLTGMLPFEADTEVGMLQKQISDTPMPLHVRREGLPEWCETIVQRALAKSPGDRFQSAEEFREALGRTSGMAAAIDFAKEFAPRPPLSASEPAVTAEPPYVATITLPKRDRPQTRNEYLAAAVSLVALLVAGIAMLAYVARETPVAAPAWAPAPFAHRFPPLVFEATALVGQRERTAQLLLADGKVTVVAANNPQQPVHSVPFARVTSINYSRGEDPMWNSPKGRARAGRTRGALGVFRLERHWITLRTDIDDRFIILWLHEELVRPVLSALEERTGRTRSLNERSRPDGGHDAETHPAL